MDIPNHICGSSVALGRSGVGLAVQGEDTGRKKDNLAQAGRIIGRLALFAMVLIVVGCVFPFQQTMKQGDEQPRNARENSSSSKDTALIKPKLAEELDDPAKVGAPSQAQPLPAPEGTGPKPGGIPAQRRVWEDQKVKAAAQELAKGLPTVRRIQVCYQVEADEWWVTLCDDMGIEIDLKQFTWNREQEKLERFLVLKRIPSSRLDAHLATKRPGMACELVEPLSHKW